VIFSRTLLTLAAALPAVAADSAMMNLIMPDAAVVLHVDVARIAASPFGAMIGEGFHQGLSQQVQAQLYQSQPELQEKLAQWAQVDWVKDITEFAVVSGTGKSAAVLMLVRSSLTLARVKAFAGWPSNATEYDGVPVLVSAKPGNGVVAFLDDSVQVIGQPEDVRAAVRRHAQHAPLSAFWTAQIAKYAQYDIWLATAGTLPSAPLTGPAASNPAARQMVDFFGSIAGFNAAVKFSPDFELSANVDTRNQKAANDIAEGLRWASDSLRQQPETADRLKYHVTGNHVSLSLYVPQHELLARMRTMSPPRVPTNPRPAVVAPKPVPDDGPPVGTIRVQSSEGTVLIPVGKNQEVQQGFPPARLLRSWAAIPATPAASHRLLGHFCQADLGHFSQRRRGTLR
jgi:hypothetical protein